MSNDWAAAESYPGSGYTELGQRLHDEGFIFAINRLVLHPAGLALAVEGKRIEGAGAGDPMITVTGLAIVATDDPEGIVFDRDSIDRGLARLLRHGHYALVDRCDPRPDTLQTRADYLEFDRDVIDVIPGPADGLVTVVVREGSEGIVDRMVRSERLPLNVIVEERVGRVVVDV